MNIPTAFCLLPNKEQNTYQMYFNQLFHILTESNDNDNQTCNDNEKKMDEDKPEQSVFYKKYGLTDAETAMHNAMQGTIVEFAGYLQTKKIVCVFFVCVFVCLCIFIFIFIFIFALFIYFFFKNSKKKQRVQLPTPQKKSKYKVLTSSPTLTKKKYVLLFKIQRLTTQIPTKSA